MKCSIVIPSFNGKHLLEKNLPKVIKAAKGSEVVVVDDGSTDNSVAFLKIRFPKVRVVEHKKNLRYARACNSGIKASKGDIVVLLNNDVSPNEDFFKYLIPHFKNKKIFAVGCLERSKTTTRGKSVGKFKKGLIVHQEAKDQKPGITFWAFGASAAFDRGKWLELSGMDHLFRPAYWEDIDLSYRAWKRGWEVRFEPKSIVHHQPESTNIRIFGASKVTSMSFKNQLLFVWKNISDFSLLVRHILWLPTHLFIPLTKGNSLFIQGFISALIQLPEAFRSRQNEKKFVKVSDKIVLSYFS